jgi:hypothetical protein
MEIARQIPQRGTRLEVAEGCEIEIVDASPRLVRLVRLLPDRDRAAS